MHEREAAMHALGDTPEGRALRVKMQSDLLISDMSAFKAANPGSCLADFVRWHSPRDWIEDDVPGAARVDLAPSAPKGALSARMREPGTCGARCGATRPARPRRRRDCFSTRFARVRRRFISSAFRPRRCSRSSSPPPRGRGTRLRLRRRRDARTRAGSARTRGEPRRSYARETVSPPGGARRRRRRITTRGTRRRAAESLAHRLPGVPRRVLEAILRDAAEKDDARASVKTRRRTGTGKGTAAEDGRLRRRRGGGSRRLRGETRRRRVASAGNRRRGGGGGDRGGVRDSRRRWSRADAPRARRRRAVFSSRVGGGRVPVLSRAERMRIVSSSFVGCSRDATTRRDVAWTNARVT